MHSPIVLGVAGILAAAPAWSKPLPPPPERPRLVVLLVVDQFGVDAFHRYRSHYKAGLARLFAEGQFFEDARYLHADTSTGPGHATLATGAYPEVTGIVDNNYYDRALGKRVSVLNDPAQSLLDAGTAGLLDDSSPKNLLAETIGDRLRAAWGANANVVAVSYKNRAAILLAGRAGKAYWWSHTSGTFSTSTAYHGATPAWLARFDDPPPANRLFGTKWEAQIPPGRSLAPSADDAPWEQEINGLGRTFPHPLTGGLAAPGPAFYKAVFATPAGNGLILDAARAAMDAQSLGLDATPDFLGVSLSAFDYTGHTFGPHSREIEEALVALDQQIGAFLDHLDRKVGKGRWLAAVTGDHGSAPVPEFMLAAGLPAGRMPTRMVVGAAEDGLSEALGPGPWIVVEEYPTLYLDLARLSARKIARNVAERAACRGIMKLPGMQACFTRARLMRSEPPVSALEAAVRRSFHPARSGEVYPVAKPYWLWGEFADKPFSTTHDSGWPYDARVPLFLLGPGVAPGVCKDAATSDMLAATLSSLLGITPPAQANPVRLPCR